MKDRERKNRPDPVSPADAEKARKKFRAKYGGKYSDPFFSPHDDADQISIGFMRKCEGFLDIAVYSITHQEIAEAIVKASHNLKRVRVLVDKVQAAGRYSAVPFLEENGVNIVRDSQTGLMHLKIALDYVMKRGKPDPRAVLLGSYNWTKSATERNRENQLILRIKKVVMGHIEVYEEMWEANGGYEQYPHTQL